MRKRKYDGRIKSDWEGEMISAPSTDWFVVAHLPELHRKYQNSCAIHSERFFLHCLNVQKPLTILLDYGHDGLFVGSKCDAALPATFSDQIIEFCDLDLDLIVDAQFALSVRDQETFARNRVKMNYSPGTIKMAHEAISLAEELVTLRRFPFDDKTIRLFESSSPSVSERGRSLTLNLHPFDHHLQDTPGERTI